MTATCGPLWLVRTHACRTAGGKEAPKESLISLLVNDCLK